MRINLAEAFEICLQFQEQLPMQSFCQQGGRGLRGQTTADEPTEEHEGGCPQGAVFKVQIAWEGGGPLGGARFHSGAGVGGAAAHVETEVLS